MPGIASLSASLITAALAIVAQCTHDWHSNATDISDACQKAKRWQAGAPNSLIDYVLETVLELWY